MSVANLIVDSAQAVADNLNAQVAAGGFSLPFAAERCYLAEFDLSDPATIKVPVMARSVDSLYLTRDYKDEHHIGIDVGLLKKVPDFQTQTLDPLMLLIEEIKSFLRTQLSGAPGRSVRRTTDPIYDPARLREKHEFFSVTTFDFLTIA